MPRACESRSDRAGHWEEYNWQLIEGGLGEERKIVTVGC